jgi:hypothetical protein
MKYYIAGQYVKITLTVNYMHSLFLFLKKYFLNAEL